MLDHDTPSVNFDLGAGERRTIHPWSIGVSPLCFLLRRLVYDFIKPEADAYHLSKNCCVFLEWDFRRKYFGCDLLGLAASAYDF